MRKDSPISSKPIHTQQRSGDFTTLSWNPLPGTSKEGKMIAKITNNLEKFNYNVIIANMYETYNFLSLFIKEKNITTISCIYETNNI